MNIDEAKAAVGSLVMSRHSKKLGEAKPHGPYILLKVTRAGMAIIQRAGPEEEKPLYRGEMQVAPRLLSRCELR